MSSTADQLNAAYAARHEMMEQANATAKKLIEQGKHKEGAAIMHEMMDKLKTGPVEQILKNNRSTSIPKPSAETGKSLLPKGISGGKIAAIAAGVAVVGGGVMIYRNHQKQKEQSWVVREEQRRAMGSQNISL